MIDFLFYFSASEVLTLLHPEWQTGKELFDFPEKDENPPVLPVIDGEFKKRGNSITLWGES